MEPQRYCVWLSKADYTYRVALHPAHLVTAESGAVLRGQDTAGCAAALADTQPGDAVVAGA